MLLTKTRNIVHQPLMTISFYYLFKPFKTIKELQIDNLSDLITQLINTLAKLQEAQTNKYKFLISLDISNFCNKAYIKIFVSWFCFSLPGAQIAPLIGCANPFCEHFLCSSFIIFKTLLFKNNKIFSLFHHYTCYSIVLLKDYLKLSPA